MGQENPELKEIKKIDKKMDDIDQRFDEKTNEFIKEMDVVKKEMDGLSAQYNTFNESLKTAFDSIKKDYDDLLQDAKIDNQSYIAEVNITNNDGIIEINEKKTPPKVQEIIDKLDQNTLSVELNEYDRIGKNGIGINNDNIKYILNEIYNKCPNIEEICFEGNNEFSLLSDNINNFPKLKKISFLETKVSFNNLNKITNKSNIIFDIQIKNYGTGSFTYRQINANEGFYIGGKLSESKGFEYSIFKENGINIEEFKFGRVFINGEKYNIKGDVNNILSFTIEKGWNCNFGTENCSLFKYNEFSDAHKEFMGEIAKESGFTKQKDLGIENQKDWQEEEVGNIERKKKEWKGGSERNIYDFRDKNINKEAWYAFEEMFLAMKKDNLNGVGLGSTYRSIDYQVSIYFDSIYHSFPNNTEMAEKLTNEEKRIIKNDYLKRSKLAAPPGYSEHHTGKAFDILGDSGRLEENDKEFIWLKKNAKQFGFELSYPDPNSDRYEPRHRLYVGKK